MRWVVLDVSYLMHRAFHAVGKLSHGDAPTGALFGFMRDLRGWHTARAVGPDDSEAVDGVVFAFDSPPSHREREFPYYKETRRKRKFTDAEAAAREELAEQIRQLRTRILPDLGYANVFAAPGFEGDDVIASVCAAVRGDAVEMVGNDGDLLQLLTPAVTLVTPTRGGAYSCRDCAGFRDEHDLHPRQWAEVKAIAGCGTDDIPGLGGVGEVTAVRWLSGQTPRDTAERTRFTKIRGYVKTEQYADSLRLASLPWAGCPVFRPEPGPPPSDEVWNRVCGGLGMASLLVGGREPIRRRA